MDQAGSLGLIPVVSCVVQHPSSRPSSSSSSSPLALQLCYSFSQDLLETQSYSSLPDMAVAWVVNGYLWGTGRVNAKCISIW